MRLNKSERDLYKLLDQWRGMIRQMGHWNHSGYVYHGIEDFVLSNGKWYKPAPLPKGVRRGVPKSCFFNASMLAARRGWKYIEGFALAEGVEFLPVHHAWVVNQEGCLIDNTWRTMGLAYIGVEFSVGRAVEALNVDNATVLDNPARRNILYKERWTGEDYSLKWKARRTA